MYDASREIKKIMEECCTASPPLEEHHFDVLEDIEMKKNNALNTNRTKFYINEIYRYTKEQKVFRTAHMGETRGGKTEGSLMTCLIQQHFYNKLFSEGYFDNVEVDIPKGLIDFNVNHIHRDATYYREDIRERFKKGEITYGEINQIDETKESSGGLGTMSEKIEMTNYNNIIAKYNLAEHWINPQGFIQMNTSYGIHWFIKDVKKRRNWGLLYRLEAWSKGISPQSFIGWVCFPLHEHHELRKAYELKKNAWINEIIKGGGDPRSELRRAAAEIIAQDEDFSAMKTNKSFVLTNDQQLDIIDDYISQAKIMSFNADERKRIMSRAQLIAKKRLFPDMYGNEQIKE
jgi:hypothetical protein